MALANKQHLEPKNWKIHTYVNQQCSYSVSVNVRERERECESMYVFVTNVLDKGGSLPPNPRPEADRDGNRTTTPTTAPRSTKDLRPHIRAFIQAREGGRPQMGSPRPKGESPREPEATGTLVRFKGPRCPRTSQHPAENFLK